ncbi:uncharacterized protein LOC122951805 [Acropora millepora]|uniref:uncharacterized protein LOC122951805 n=1 Tax=Acropora millepora TaxID=45264 RepID=UPI001CF16E64|nr:uncharacterized protein LOC122951805 [Acropora millepora]
MWKDTRRQQHSLFSLLLATEAAANQGFYWVLNNRIMEASHLRKTMIVYRAGTEVGPSFDSDKTIDEAWLVTNPKLYFPLGQELPELCKKRLEGIFLWQADVSTLSKDFTYCHKYDGIIQLELNGSRNSKDTFKEIQAHLKWEQTTVPQCNEGLSVMDLSPLVQAVTVYLKDHFPTTPRELNFHAELKAAGQWYWLNDKKDPLSLKKVPPGDCRLKIAVRDTLETWEKEEKDLREKLQRTKDRSSDYESADQECSDVREAIEVLKNYLGCKKDIRKVIVVLKSYFGDDKKEMGDKDRNVRVYTTDKRAFQSLGEAFQYLEEELKIAREISGQGGEGGAYENLAIEIGDHVGVGRAHGNLGFAYHSLGDYQKAIEYQEKHLKIAMKSGDRNGEGTGYGNLEKEEPVGI